MSGLPTHWRPVCTLARSPGHGALLPDKSLDVGEVLVLVKQFAPDADMLRDLQSPRRIGMRRTGRSRSILRRGGACALCRPRVCAGKC